MTGERRNHDLDSVVALSVEQDPAAVWRHLRVGVCDTDAGVRERMRVASAEVTDSDRDRSVVLVVVHQADRFVVPAGLLLLGVRR